MRRHRRWTRAALASLTGVGLIAGLAVVAAAPPAHAAFPGANGPIVWSEDVFFPAALNKLDPTTGINTTICTGCDSSLRRPAVSADGQTVVFQQATSNVLGLISINGGAIT